MFARLSAEKLAGLSVAVALAVLALKLAAWRMTGSVALFSDAMDNLVNVATAVMAWLAIRVAARPADIGHPFGHTKAEYLSAVAEGVLIVLAALLICREAVLRLGQPELDTAPWDGMAVNGVAAAVNALWAMILIREGRRRRSPAMAANGRHTLADVWTSAGVIVGLGLAVVTGWHVLDPLLALAVALNILREGWIVVSGSVHGLMDAAASEEERAEIEAVIRGSADGALQYHDVLTRRAGPALFVEFHLVVASGMPVGEAHGICDRIEAEMTVRIPGARTTIHVEPAHKAKDSGRVPD